MPYISDKNRRRHLDEIVELMRILGVKANGDLNYILFKYARNHVVPSYNNYKNYLGELAEVSAEIRRRLLAKYEDKKIQENSDVE